ncbi:MAG: helix-turn-helix transcriptional regulator [Coriobacteriales bacterium]|nr:helix-turn-helix transcriptional regulator [Coriobacteriales bacterium]
MKSKNHIWHILVALELGSILFLSDTKVLLPATVFNTWFQSIFIGIGSVAPVPFLLYHYGKHLHNNSKCLLETRSFAQSKNVVLFALVMFMIGLLFCRVLAPLSEISEPIKVTLVVLGSLLRGTSCTLLLVALLENVAFLPGRMLMLLVGTAIFFSGILDTITYSIGNTCAFCCAIILAVALFPLHLRSNNLLNELPNNESEDSQRVGHSIEDCLPGSIFDYSGGLYATIAFLLLTFLLSLLNPLLRTPLALLTQQGFTVEATRICTSVGFILAGCIICLLAQRSTEFTSAPGLSLVVVALCELFYLLAVLFDSSPILTVIFCGIARKTAFLIMFVVIAMQRRMVTSLSYGLLSISAAGLALFVSGCSQAIFSQLESDITGVARSAILIGAFLLMTACIIRFVGLLDSDTPVTTEPAAATEHGFLDDKGLTERENQIAMLLACGLSFNEIANNLYLSPSTIRVHASRIYAKCNVATQAEFIAAYYDVGAKK